MNEDELCPFCGSDNIDDDWYCLDCDTDIDQELLIASFHEPDSAIVKNNVNWKVLEHGQWIDYHSPDETA